ncbi:MAG: pantoate--beta-alanine ligase [Bacteroidota bacterium]
MEIFYRIAELKDFISEAKKKNKIIGFVPTMGALHKGHLSLVSKSNSECDITIASIFVNPIQFNDKKDFEKYPRTNDSDIFLLKHAECDAVFIPSVNEMYPEEVNMVYNFGILENVMEGRFRPGHFNGVAIVVKRLFELVPADKSFFGEKDFQQLLIIKDLVKQLNLKMEIIGCPIVREPDGLAMSSRNVRLSEDERKEASNINKILSEAKGKYKNLDINLLKAEVESKISSFPKMKLDYFEIVNRNTLEPVENWDDYEELIECIAVFVGEVRLIDNMFIK